MKLDFLFFINSILFGIGLAMDAFSVSMANGLNEPKMRLRKRILIAGTFGFFQIIMPLIGWFCIHTIAEKFKAFQKFIPFIALALLLYIGIEMLVEGIRNRKEEGIPLKRLTVQTLILQGIATSIDALSVGFTIAEYPLYAALVEALIIGIVTFGICLIGVRIGKIFGLKLKSKASILGGIILIAIGLEIFIKGLIEIL